MDYVAFVSWGNDSIALVQWLHEHNFEGVTCVFSDTGWASCAPTAMPSSRKSRRRSSKP
jgi:hypothetical protein